MGRKGKVSGPLVNSPFCLRFVEKVEWGRQINDKDLEQVAGREREMPLDAQSWKFPEGQ